MLSCSVLVAASALGLPLVARSQVSVRPVSLPCGADESPGAPTLLQLARPGDVVARIETVAGASTPFLLRATVPVPRGTLRRGAASAPLRVRDADGAFAPTQVEVVAQHPRDADGASVVEVLALVQLPSGAAPGVRVQYDVVCAGSVAAPFVPTAPAAALWAAPAAVLLRAHDVHGTLYQADLLREARTGGATLRVLGEGLLRRTERTHETLLPAAPGPGAPPLLPHSVGALVHLTRWAHTGCVGVDLVLHDAFAGRDAGDPADDVLGDLLFDALELVLPSGWQAVARVEDPYLGSARDDGIANTTPVVAPLAGGAFHCLPQLARFQRRFVLAPPGEESTARALAQEDGLGFVLPGSAAVPLFSWWNPATPHYWPQSVPLPLWNETAVATLRAQQAASCAALATTLALGTPGPGGYPVPSPVLGWAHPWGVAYGGMGGGDEIWLWDGVDVAAARMVEGVRAAQMRMRMYVCRQPNTLYERDGSPLDLEASCADGPAGRYLPVWWYNGPLLAQADPWGLRTADQSQRELARAAGRLAPYDAALRAYAPVDYQHYVRHTRTLKTLVWLANDLLARSELEAQAESWRLSYPQLPQRTNGDAIVTGFLAQRRYVDAHPGNGLDFTRAHAWGLDALVAWHSLAPESGRARYIGLLRDVARLVADGQASCGGTILAAASNHDFGGQYSVRTQTETAMVEHALAGLRHAALDGVDPCASQMVARTLARSFASTIDPLVWRTESPPGPLFKVAVGPADRALPLFCSFVPPDGRSTEVDAYQCPSSLAHGYLASGDPVYLQRAVELLGIGDLPQLLQAPLVNWQNRLALQRLAQDLAAPH